MHVEGEKPLSMDLKGHGIWCSGAFWAEAYNAYHFALPSGAPHDAVPPEPCNHDHRSAPWGLTGPLWCSSVPRLVSFRSVAPLLAKTGGGGLSLVWGVWFPSHLATRGAIHIQVIRS
jgi:hypothetical protein